MAPWLAVCRHLGLFLSLLTCTVQVISAKPSENAKDKTAAIKKLVTAYNTDHDWSELRTKLEPHLDNSSAAYKQLLRIPADEELPLKKASAVPGYLDLLTALLDAGLDADSTAGSHADTMLHWASLRGLQDVFELLLARGAGLERRTSGGATALLLAARNGHTELARTLLGRGADPAASTHDGWTSLHCAATRGDVELARLLVAAGAPTSGLARTRWGSSTPLDVARIYEQPRVEEYLSSLETPASNTSKP